MKRVVSSSIITLLILLVIAGAFIYFRNFRSGGGDPVQAIPADVSFFMVIEPDSSGFKNLSEYSFWKSINRAPAFASLRQMITALDSSMDANPALTQFVSGGPVFVSAHVTSASRFDFLFLKSVNAGFNESAIDKLITEIAGIGAEPSKRNYDGNLIRELPVEGNKVFTYSISKGVFMGSFTSFIVEDALRQLKIGKPVFENYQDANENFETTGFNLFLNFTNLPAFFNIFTDSEKSSRLSSLRTFGNWAVAGTEFANEYINFNGYMPEVDSTFMISCFNGQEPVAKNLLKILPGKTAHVQYIGLSNFQSYYKHFSGQFLNSTRRKKVTGHITSTYKFDIEQKMLEWIGNEYALVITEPSGMSYDNNCFAVFKTINIEQAKKSLKDISRLVDKKSGSTTMEEVYNDYTIGLVRLNNVLPALFGDMFNKIPGMYYTSVGDYMVFANKASSLRAFIDDYRAGSSLVKTEYFKKMQSRLPASGNFFYMTRPAASFYILKSVANNQWKEHIDLYRDVFADISNFSFQISAEEKHHRFTAAFEFKPGGDHDGVSMEFSVETDSAVTMKPLLTTDPETKTRQIVFQDKSEMLYLADNSGNVVWKQQLSGGGILGEIHEIDLFKNNSRQFLFNTREYMFLLDIEGKPVGNFPIRLPAPATNGMAVYDFDGRKEPRIYVACENNAVYAYLPSGKPLPGWVFREKTGKVNDQIRWVTIGGKEWLFIADDNGGCYIINRFGETGVPVADKIFPADNTSYFTDAAGSLVFTDIESNIIRINPSGNVENIPLNAAGAKHGFLYQDADADGEQDYIFTNNNELIAYNKNLVMIYRKVFEYELSGKIELFSLRSGEKVMGLHAVGSDKTWLVKMNGSPLQGFPVRGSGPAVIDELNLDGNQNLFVGGSDGRFYVYSLE